MEGTAGRLLDAHAHLGDPVFDPDREAVLERAREAGVAAVVLVGETLADARRNLELAARFPGVLLPSAGLYPTHVDRGQAAEMTAFVRAHRSELIAIGEVGLDHYKVEDPADREVQREIFAGAIALSLELDLPLNIHSRSAGRAVIEMLLSLGAKRALLHAFDGRASTALPAVEAGFFFSVPPSIVRSRQKRKLVKHLPLESLLLETDSPVLGPEPGERNEPRNVAVSLREVAAIRGVPEETVAEAVRENARRLFGDRAP
jgi:TatD DNase family protein